MATEKCADYRDWLVDYADGELVGDPQRQLARHLAKCARCRRVVADLKRSLELATALWSDAASGVSTGTDDAFDTTWPRRGRRHTRVVVTAAVSIVLAVAATILLVITMTSPRPRPVRPAAPQRELAVVTPAKTPQHGTEGGVSDADIVRVFQQYEHAARRHAAARIIKEMTAKVDVDARAQEYLSSYVSEKEKTQLD